MQKASKSELRKINGGASKLLPFLPIGAYALHKFGKGAIEGWQEKSEELKEE